MLRATMYAATLFCYAQIAEAGLMVSVESASLTPGSTTAVDVVISSDEPLGDDLGLFGFEFRISSTGPTRLDFVDPQSDLQLSDGNYVFAGDSLAALIPPVGIVDTTVLPNDTFIGGDATFSGGSENVDTTELLLARLEITAATALPPIVGDAFTIELIDGAFTFFQTDAFDDLELSSAPGTVLIVPEPNAGYLCLAGLLLLVSLAFSRRRAAWEDAR